MPWYMRAATRRVREERVKIRRQIGRVLEWDFGAVFMVGFIFISVCWGYYNIYFRTNYGNLFLFYILIKINEKISKIYQPNPPK